MTYKLDGLPGVEPDDVEQLCRVGIVSTGSLLEHCANAGSRAQIAERTGIDEQRLLDWARRVDLARISGVGPNTVDRLLRLGIHSVEDLRAYEADDLGRRLRQGTCAHEGQSVSLGRIARWIRQSNQLRVVLR